MLQDKRGNGMADRYSKLIAKEVRVEQRFRDARTARLETLQVVVDWVARVGCPAAKVDTTHRKVFPRKRKQELQLVKDIREHCPVVESDMVWCSVCRQVLTAKLREAQCPGSPFRRATGIRQIHLFKNERPHTLAKLCGVPDRRLSPVVMCLVCGAFGSRVFRLLMEPCKGVPAACGQRALEDLAENKMPGTAGEVAVSIVADDDG